MATQTKHEMNLIELMEQFGDEAMKILLPFFILLVGYLG